MAEALELAQVSKVYEVGGVELVALNSVDLSVTDREVVTLLGPSGSGKTTLLSIAGGLLSPSSGRVIVGGDDITHASARRLTKFRRQRVGFIFQGANLVPFLTARENLVIVSELSRRDSARAQRRADQLMERLGMSHRMDNLPGQLSGGERQRVAIGRALMNEPTLVLVDEPTSALDSQLGEQVMQLIVSEVKARDAAAVIVTHDQRMTRYGDRILTMADGRIASIQPRPEWTTGRPDLAVVEADPDSGGHPEVESWPNEAVAAGQQPGYDPSLSRPGLGLYGGRSGRADAGWGGFPQRIRTEIDASDDRRGRPSARDPRDREPAPWTNDRDTGQAGSGRRDPGGAGRRRPGMGPAASDRPGAASARSDPGQPGAGTGRSGTGGAGARGTGATVPWATPTAPGLGRTGSGRPTLPDRPDTTRTGRGRSRLPDRPGSSLPGHPGRPGPTGTNRGRDTSGAADGGPEGGWGRFSELRDTNGIGAVGAGSGPRDRGSSYDDRGRAAPPGGGQDQYEYEDWPPRQDETVEARAVDPLADDPLGGGAADADRVDPVDVARAAINRARGQPSRPAQTGRPPVGRPPVGRPPVGRPPVGRPPAAGPPAARPPATRPPTSAVDRPVGPPPAARRPPAAPASPSPRSDPAPAPRTGLGRRRDTRSAEEIFWGESSDDSIGDLTWADEDDPFAGTNGDGRDPSRGRSPWAPAPAGQVGSLPPAPAEGEIRKDRKGRRGRRK